MEKNVVGVFHSKPEAIHVIDDLKRQGYRTADITVIAKTRSDIDMVMAETGVAGETSVTMNTLSGAMMDSFFTLMTGGMIGGNANGLAHKLTRMGISDAVAKQCEAGVDEEKILVIVNEDAPSNQVYNTVAETRYETDSQRALRLREEQLDVTKERVQIGEVQLRKEIVEEQRTLHVPLTHEEVYVERRPIVDGQFDGSPIAESETIRVPVMEERIEVTKRPVVIEEVIVGKSKVEETKQVHAIVKREEARIDRSGLPIVEEKKNFTNIITVTDSKEEGISIGNVPHKDQDITNIITVTDNKEEGISIGNVSIVHEDQEIIALANDVLNEKKEEMKVERSTPSATYENRSSATSANNKKEKTSVKRSEPPEVGENKKNTTTLENKKNK